MSEQTFFQLQALELRQLLENAGDDPILAPQLRERLEEVERELEATRKVPGTLLPKESVDLPRAAIFLSGGGVEGSLGIRATLAGEVLVQYEKCSPNRRCTMSARLREEQAASGAGAAPLSRSVVYRHSARLVWAGVCAATQ